MYHKSTPPSILDRFLDWFFLFFIGDNSGLSLEGVADGVFYGELAAGGVDVFAERDAVRGGNAEFVELA